MKCNLFLRDSYSTTVMFTGFFRFVLLFGDIDELIFTEVKMVATPGLEPGTPSL